MRISDWSSDVCSSDLIPRPARGPGSEKHQRSERARHPQRSTRAAPTGKYPLVARVSGRGARSRTGWGSDRVLGVGPCAPARSGGEAGLGWVTSSDGAVGSGDLEDPGVVHGDVPPAPMDEVVVPGAQEHEVGELGGPAAFPVPDVVSVAPLGLAITRSEERRVGKECVSTCSFRWSL